jgi:hypothetical protein
MGVTKRPETYSTSDGKEFTDANEAARHEAAVQAVQEFGEARKRLGRLLAGSQRTADGQAFEMGIWRDYYHLAPGYFDMPALVPVNFSYQTEFGLDESGAVTLIKTEHDRSGARRDTSYRVSDLYFRREAAEEALLAAQEAWLAERVEDVAKLRARVVPTEEPQCS